MGISSKVNNHSVLAISQSSYGDRQLVVSISGGNTRFQTHGLTPQELADLLHEANIVLPEPSLPKKALEPGDTILETNDQFNSILPMHVTAVGKTRFLALDNDGNLFSETSYGIGSFAGALASKPSGLRYRVLDPNEDD